MVSVEERVINTVCEYLGVTRDQLNRQTSFQRDMHTDSLDLTELMMELEEEFDITIPVENAERIRTVGDAIAYIEREQAKR